MAEDLPLPDISNSTTPVADHTYGAMGVHGYGLGYAAHKKPRNPPPTMRADYDQVCAPFICFVHDHCLWKAFQHGRGHFQSGGSQYLARLCDIFGCGANDDSSE